MTLDSSSFSLDFLGVLAEGGIDPDFMERLFRCADDLGAQYRVPVGQGSFTDYRAIDRISRLEKHVLVESNQSAGYGEFNERKAAKVIDKIKEKIHLYSITDGITLDPKRLASPRILSGGTCSAMSLLVASKLLELQKSTLSSFKVLEDHMIHLIKEHAFTSNKNFRAIQAAFNTIIVPETCEVTPADKIKLLGIQFDIRGITQSKIFDSFAEDPSSSEDIRGFLELDGVYVARAIKDADPLKEDEVIKQECKGHSTVIFKQTIETESRIYFYDPNVGIKIIDATRELGKQIQSFQHIIARTYHLSKFQMVKFVEGPA